jgi:hypothetical protein
MPEDIATEPEALVEEIVVILDKNDETEKNGPVSEPTTE